MTGSRFEENRQPTSIVTVDKWKLLDIAPIKFYPSNKCPVPSNSDARPRFKKSTPSSAIWAPWFFFFPTYCQYNNSTFRVTFSFFFHVCSLDNWKDNHLLYWTVEVFRTELRRAKTARNYLVKYVFDVTNGTRKAVAAGIREDAGKLERNEFANGTPPFLGRKVLRRRSVVKGQANPQVHSYFSRIGGYGTARANNSSDKFPRTCERSFARSKAARREYLHTRLQRRCALSVVRTSILAFLANRSSSGNYQPLSNILRVAIFLVNLKVWFFFFFFNYFVEINHLDLSRRIRFSVVIVFFFYRAASTFSYFTI